MIFFSKFRDFKVDEYLLFETTVSGPQIKSTFLVVNKAIVRFERRLITIRTTNSRELSDWNLCLVINKGLVSSRQ